MNSKLLENSDLKEKISFYFIACLKWLDDRVVIETFQCSKCLIMGNFN